MAPAVTKKKTAKKSGRSSPPVQPDLQALYLYGISLPPKSSPEIRAEAVDGRSRVHSVQAEGFACWISRVDRSEFADRLTENMENLEWLATVGVRHQRAVAELASKVEILPARFGTVFLSEQSLAGHVKAGKKSFAATLKTIAGADEWGVKVFRVAQPGRVVAATDSSGTDYLKRKAQTVMPKSKAEDPQLLEFARSLSGASLATAPGGKASTAQPQLAWHASFLVPRKAQKKFQEALRKYTAQLSDVYRVECSGPWPPYSFVGQHG